MRTSFRRRSFSWIKSICGSGVETVLRSLLIQRVNDDNQIPKPDATCLRLSPLAMQRAQLPVYILLLEKGQIYEDGSGLLLQQPFHEYISTFVRTNLTRPDQEISI